MKIASADSKSALLGHFRLYGSRALRLSVCSLAMTTGLLAQNAQSKPSPTPRRALPKPVAGSRGFEQFAQRDASVRLIAASSTRNINDRAASAYNRGQQNFDAHDYEAAVQDFKAAVKLDPESVEAHYALALALTREDKPDQAIPEFDEALKLNPSDELKIWSHYLKGNAYAETGDYRQAIASYREAIKLKSDLSKPHYNLGLAYAALGQLAEAVAEFKTAVKLKPDYAEAYYNLGVAHVQSGRSREAEKEQRILVKLNPDLASKLGVLIRNSPP